MNKKIAVVSTVCVITQGVQEKFWVLTQIVLTTAKQYFLIFEGTKIISLKNF